MNNNPDARINSLIKDAYSEHTDSDDNDQKLCQDEDSESDDQNADIRFLSHVKHSQSEEDKEAKDSFGKDGNEKQFYQEGNKNQRKHQQQEREKSHESEDEQDQEEDLFYVCTIHLPLF